MTNKPLTLAEKVWNDHLVAKGENGSPDLLYIDRHLVHEVTSPQAFDGLRLAGRQVRRLDQTIATEDHNTPTWDIDKPIADVTSRTQINALRENAKEFLETHPDMMKNVEIEVLKAYGVSRNGSKTESTTVTTDTAATKGATLAGNTQQATANKAAAMAKAPAVAAATKK